MKKIIIIVLVLLVILGIYFFVFNNKANAPAAPQNNIIANIGNAAVSINNFAFNPETLTVKAGTTVVWTNNDSVAHTITSDSDGLLNSPTLSPGQTFSFTFTSPGTTAYHCNIHKMMKGTIVVE